MSVGQGITDLFDRMHGPEAVRARRQTRIWRNTVEVDDGSVKHRDNPLEDNPLRICETKSLARCARVLALGNSWTEFPNA